MQIKILRKDFWKGQRLLLLTFLVLHTCASFYYISQHNITFDEPDYIEYAKRWLHGHPERTQSLDDSKSPIIAVAWVPRIVRQIINPNYELHDYGRQDQKEGRYMMILFSFLAAVYVYKWCRDLYGTKGWIVPVLLLLFDPLYLAYSTIVTTDLACAAFLVALLYHYRKYLVHKSRKDFYLAALLTGLGIVTKQALVFTIILLPMLSIAYHSISGAAKNFLSKKTFADLLLFAVMILVIINCMYYFHHSFIQLGKYTFESASLGGLQKQLSFLRWLPVPLPEAYVQSIDLLKAHSEIGAGTLHSTSNGVYLFGELKFTGGWWYYYLVHLFFKMPIGIMFLFLSCVPVLFARFNKRAFAQQYLFLLLPIFFYWVILSFFNQFQAGLRHLLVVFPLLYIGLGYLFKHLIVIKPAYKILAGGAIVYVFISVAMYYPYIIPYTNEFISNKKTVYRKIWDSSVDYGQSDSSLVKFIAAHPEYKKAQATPDTGKYAVLMGEMMNTYFRNANPYKWYQAFEPKGQSRYVILLFDISRRDLDNADWKKTELKIIP